MHIDICIIEYVWTCIGKQGSISKIRPHQGPACTHMHFEILRVCRWKLSKFQHKLNMYTAHVYSAIMVSPIGVGFTGSVLMATFQTFDFRMWVGSTPRVQQDCGI